MAEEVPKRQPGARSRRDVFLDRLFAVLNFVLSGPPEWQEKPQKLTREQKRARQMDYGWGALLGLILFLLNTILFFPGFEALNVTSDTGFIAVLRYLPLVFLAFFLVGLLRGWLKKTAGAALRPGMIAGLIGILPHLFLTVVASLRTNDLEGFFYFYVAVFWEPTIGCLQIMIGVGGLKLGGVIGSRFLHKRPAQERPGD